MSATVEASELRRAYAAGVLVGLTRHTWMLDGITYVGNGTYTLKDARELLVRDGVLTEDEATVA